MNNDLTTRLEKQKVFFASRATKSIPFRIRTLEALEKSIIKHQDDLMKAAEIDLHKSTFEVLQGETSQSLTEIRYALKHINEWTRPKKAASPNFFPFSRGTVQNEPFGVSLIFSPFNHPFSTTFAPLVSAITAGNCVIIKPSELVPTCANLIEQIIKEAFIPEHVSVIQGDRVISEQLLELNFDHIFFTGSTSVGKLIMSSASEKLIPVTLQLGGKCPGIVDAEADIESAATRIAWGKFWNAGQSCNTIDHLYIHESIKTKFIEALVRNVTLFYGAEPLKSKDYGRIINNNHITRLSKYLDGVNIIHGGQIIPEQKFISPTIIDSIPESSPINTEEIFGPILPCYYYQNLDEMLNKIKNKPKPLAIYAFTKDKKIAQKILNDLDSGTACINDLMIQASSPALPIGGVGQSGFGDIHGYDGFRMFSHTRSILWQSRFDLPFRFPPYNERFLISLLKKLL